MCKIEYGISFCFLVSVLGGMLSCVNKTDSGVNLDSVSVRKTILLSKDSDSPVCEISLSVKYIKDGGAVSKVINNAINDQLFSGQGASLRQSVDSFASKYGKDYVDNLSAFYVQDKGDASRRSWYEYRYTLTTNVLRGRDEAIVYVVKKSYFEGGAHGITQQTVMNFNSVTGHLLELKDIFVPGYEKRLSAVLQQALEEKTGAENIEELHEKGYLYSMDMFASSNFIFGKNGMIFIYNPYEIAPYDKGLMEIFVDYADMDELLIK